MARQKGQKVEVHSAAGNFIKGISRSWFGRQAGGCKKRVPSMRG